MAPKPKSTKCRGETSAQREIRSKRRFEDPYFRSSENKDLFEETFQYKNVILGRCISDVDHFREHGFIEPFEFQGWGSLLSINLPIYPKLVRAFFSNLQYSETQARLSSYLLGKTITLNPSTLGQILGIPASGSKATIGSQWNTDPFTKLHQTQTLLDDQSIQVAFKPPAQRLPVHHRVMHHILTYNLIPRDGHRDHVTFIDMNVLTHLISHVPFNLPHLMIWQIIEAHRKGTSLPYGLLFTRIFQHLDLDLQGEELVQLRVHDFYTESTFRRMRLRLTDGGYRRRADVPPSTSSSDDESEEDEYQSAHSAPAPASAPDTTADASDPSYVPPDPTSSSLTEMREDIQRLRQDHDSLRQEVSSMRQDVSQRLDTLTDLIRQHFSH